MLLKAQREGKAITPEFAQSLADLMEWMVENCPDPEAVSRALEAVNSAHGLIRELRIQDPTCLRSSSPGRPAQGGR
jgi:hypothetical protein